MSRRAVCSIVIFVIVFAGLAVVYYALYKECRARGFGALYCVARPPTGK